MPGKTSDDLGGAALRARKDSHLDLVLAGAGEVAGASTGFELVRFEHRALPELDLKSIDLSCDWLGKRLRAPLLISSMTGGPERAARINRHLAEAAETLGIALGVGSQRVALQGGGSGGLDRGLRQAVPSVPLLSNIGAAQLVQPGGGTLARHAVEALEADALIVHLNPLQEALQPEGDGDWRGVLGCIAQLVRTLPVPVVVKEVGAGIGPATALQLWNAGVTQIDIAGAGGTSWAAIEARRARTAGEQAVAETFAAWGVPTAEAVASVRRVLPSATLIASGGIRDGLHVAKAIRLGADIVGQAASALPSATASAEAVVSHFSGVIAQLRVACFCTGSPDLAALRRAHLLPRPDLALFAAASSPT